MYKGEWIHNHYFPHIIESDQKKEGCFEKKNKQVWQRSSAGAMAKQVWA